MTLGGDRTRHCQYLDGYVGDLVITRDAAIPYSATVSGNVIVHGNSTLLVYGTVDGNIRVQARGSVLIEGIVTGDVSNIGGVVHLYGSILGRLHSWGPTVIDRGAHVGSHV